MTKTIDIQTAHISLDEVLSLIRQGTEVIMTDANIRLARIVPSVESPRCFGNSEDSIPETP